MDICTVGRFQQSEGSACSYNVPSCKKETGGALATLPFQTNKHNIEPLKKNAWDWERRSSFPFGASGKRPMFQGVFCCC